MQTNRYSTVAIVLHWAIAILILSQIAGGLYMHNLPNSAPAKFDLYQLHKSFGLSILALSLFRLGWRFTHRPPALPAEMANWQSLIARATHWLFYFLMIATPLLGLAIVSVSPKDIPTLWFGIIPVPHLGFLDPSIDPAQTEHSFIELHEKFAFAILSLFALHVGAALKHHFFNKDGVLTSMSPLQKSVLAGVALLFVVLGITSAVYFSTKNEKPGSFDTDHLGHDKGQERSLDSNQAGAKATVCQNGGPLNWRVDPSQSTLTFTGTQDGREFTGAFSDFTTQISFYEAALDTSWISVSVATPSATTGAELRDTTMPGGEWFDVKDHPQATFMSCHITKIGDGQFTAKGFLVIKDISREINLPFSLAVDGDVAWATGSVDLVRTNFDLGSGQSWLNEEGVGLEVRVDVEIVATRIN